MEFFDLYGPDGSLIYRMPRNGTPGAQQVAKAAARPPVAGRTSMADQAMAAGVLGTGLTPGDPPPPLLPAHSAPRQYQYSYGYNYPTRPRATEKIGFPMLRSFSQLYDVARMCIETRQDELRGLDWDIVPTEEGQGISDRYKDEIKATRKFFDRPDRANTFDGFINALSEDWLAIDALTIYKRRTRKGELYSLEFVDGATIKPLLDRQGRVPFPPDIAYEQYIQGMAETQYTSDELIYRPHRVRSYSPYGLAPLEWLLLTINVDLKLQYKFLMWFTEGNIPAAFGEVPETWNPTQIQEWQELWDAWLQGDEAAKAQIKWVPKANIKTIGDPTFETKFPEFLLKKTCAAFKVSPQELGFTADVNRATAGSQEDIQYRRSIKPTVDFFESIFTDVIQNDLKLPMLKFKFIGIEEEEDALKVAQVDEIYIRSGVTSPDEVRERNGQKVDANQPVGRLFMTASGPVFVDQIKEAQAAAADQPQDSPEGKAPGAVTEDKSGTGGANRKEKPENETSTTENGKEKPGEDQVKVELAQWKKWATKRFERGKSLTGFEAHAIPESVAQRIHTALQKAASPVEVKAAFALPSSALSKAAAKPPKPSAALANWVSNTARVQAEATLQARLSQFLRTEAPRIAEHVVSNLEKAADAQTLRKRKDDPTDGYDWERWSKVLFNPTKRQLKASFKAGQNTAKAQLESSFTLRHDAAELYAASRAAEMVGKRLNEAGELVDNPNAEYAITDSTRDMLRGLIQNALEEGWSIDDLQAELEASYAFSGTRAQAIARTETGIAYNRGSIQGYRDSGEVEEVDVVDGEDFDDECAQANGERWTLDEADANPLEHPNCTRYFLPVVKDPAGDSGDDTED